MEQHLVDASVGFGQGPLHQDRLHAEYEQAAPSQSQAAIERVNSQHQSEMEH